MAGTFYPADPQLLRRAIQETVLPDIPKVKAYGCMLPHAGYAYSGKVAGRTISEVAVGNQVILFGPNHTGAGAPLSVADSGEWLTPLGAVKIDAELAQALLDASSYLEADTVAHENEHSLEVLLPFLQYANHQVRIVPICVMVSELEIVRQTAREIAGVIKQRSRAGDVLLVASSDMTHYESEHEARRKDTAVIHAIRRLDEARLFETVSRLNVSMCGYAPVGLMLACARELGASSARLVMYETSGAATHDHSSVVGYAGMIIE